MSRAALREPTARFAMWVFLASEAMLFSGLVALYVAYRATHVVTLHANLALGTINTYILLTSSLTVALAVATGRHRYLVVTLVLGLAFLVIKGVEWREHLMSHERGVFITLYFLLTGIHALHVAAGMTILGIVRRDPLRFELAALYWHLVDIVWIFLWPILYLIDR